MNARAGGELGPHNLNNSKAKAGGGQTERGKVKDMDHPCAHVRLFFDAVRKALYYPPSSFFFFITLKNNYFAEM